MKLERLKEKMLLQIIQFEKEAYERRDVLDHKIFRLQDELEGEDLGGETVTAGLFIGGAILAIVLAFDGWKEFWWFLLINCIGTAVSLTIYLYKNNKRCKKNDEIHHHIEKIRNEQLHIESECFRQLITELYEFNESQFQKLEARSMYYASLPVLIETATWIKNSALEEFNKLSRDCSHPSIEKTFKVNVFLNKVKLTGNNSYYFNTKLQELYTFDDCTAFALALHRELQRQFFYEIDQFGCNIHYEETDRSDHVLNFELSSKNMNYQENGHF